MKKTISEKFVRRAIKTQQLIEQFHRIVQYSGQPFDKLRVSKKLGE